jgi:hypothetical protein
MTEQEFYKKLKEEKLFTRFYLHVANVFSSYPHWYIGSIIGGRNADNYIDSIKSWTKRYNFRDVRIMQK